MMKKTTLEESTVGCSTAYPYSESGYCALFCGKRFLNTGKRWLHFSPRHLFRDAILALTLLTLGVQANDFAFKLYNQLSETEGNLFFSPASIEAALSMTQEGARGNTQTQFFQTLENSDGIFPTVGTSVILENANAIWVEKMFPILGTFKTAVTEKYGAKIRSADFSGQPEAERLGINSWVEGKTHNKIQNLMPAGSVNAMTRLVLVNAIYFKGDWFHAFDKARTVNAPFHPPSPEGSGVTGALEKTVTVPMMTMKPKRFGYLENDCFQCLELPYKGEEVSMLIFLPRKKINFSDLQSMFAEVETNPLRKTRVEIHLPRFKTTSLFDLKQSLTALGLTDAFDPQLADFSGISGTRDLFISAAVHKAFVEVNEEGTEAAAATGIGIGVTSMPMPPKIFRADRPFIFLIRENASGKILFMGRITNPLK